MKGSSPSSSCFVLLLLLQLGLTLQSTVPAFLWTNYRSSHSNRKDSVDYRTISQKDLAKVILAEGGWSNLLCQGENVQEPVDIGLVLVGRELQSSAIFRDQREDPELMQFLRASFSSSNFSMAFPYVSSSEENKNMESSLISGFTESCGHDLGVNSIAFLESCSVDGGNFQKLSDLGSVHDHLTAVLENKQKGQKDVIVLCSGGSGYSEEIDHNLLEGEIFSDLISSVEKSGASYSVLYASDPQRSAQYTSYKTLDRFLAEGTLNGSVDGSIFCDGVCQIKSSLLEGLFVAIVLLIILISGLCCMMGIDTPTRFEAPQE